MVNSIIKFLASLRLTVVLLVLGLILVFLGTLVQEPLGLYLAQDRFFHSFFVDLASMIAAIKKMLQMVGIVLTPSTATDVLHAPFIPVFPGGYLLGGMLVISLIAAHFVRFKFSKKKIGIFLTHLGLILLLLGQLFTDVLSTESAMRMAEGEVRNFSQDFHANELAIIDTSDPAHDRVIAIPEARVAQENEITHPGLDASKLKLKVHKFWRNASLHGKEVPHSVPVAASQGIGIGAYVQPLPPATSMDDRNLPCALVEVIGPAGSLGTWMVSSQTSAKQEFMVDGRPHQIAMRFTRYYKDFSLKLLDFRHDKYRGTEIPRDFRSRVVIDNPSTGENREVDIYMNNPLRYGGYTFYQAGFDENNDNLINKVTILQVVNNPGWLGPYLACGIMTLGLVVQFGIHLVGFATKRRTK
jgi:hypothetical protein